MVTICSTCHESHFWCGQLAAKDVFETMKIFEPGLDKDDTARKGRTSGLGDERAGSGSWSG